MTSFYEDHHIRYFKSTAKLDPSSFLTPFTKWLTPGSTILDVGCGSGRDLRWLADHGFKPTGFEFSPGLARLAEDYSLQPVIQGDFTRYDFSALKFDALLLIGALVHLQHNEFASVLLHICQAIRENGLISLSMKEGEGHLLSNDGRMFTLWQPQQLESTLTENGFKILGFNRFDSALQTEDIWLSFTLKKKGA